MTARGKGFTPQKARFCNDKTLAVEKQSTSVEVVPVQRIDLLATISPFTIYLQVREIPRRSRTV